MILQPIKLEVSIDEISVIAQILELAQLKGSKLNYLKAGLLAKLELAAQKQEAPGEPVAQ